MQHHSGLVYMLFKPRFEVNELILRSASGFENIFTPRVWYPKPTVVLDSLYLKQSSLKANTHYVWKFIYKGNHAVKFWIKPHSISWGK